MNDQEHLTQEQTTYYKTMNFVTSPARMLMSLIGTLALLAVILVVLLSYPLVVHLNGEPVTFGVVAVTLLTIYGIVTFCYAPWYTVLCGSTLFVGECANVLIRDCDFPSATQTRWIIFAFFTVGVVQRYIRKQMEPKEEKPRQSSFVEQLNQTRLERRTREYDAMNKDDRESMKRLFGDNYLTWPEFPQK